MGLFDDTAFDGQHNLLPSLSEVLKAFGDIGPADWMMLFGGLLWLFILQISLLMIDRRDHQAGMTYMLFMMTAGVTLVIALPSRLRPSGEFTRAQVWASLLLLILAGLRWYLRPMHNDRIVMHATTESAKSPSDPNRAQESLK